jgi:hypothetical protein
MKRKITLLVALVWGVCLALHATPNRPLIVVMEPPGSLQELSPEQTSYMHFAQTMMAQRLHDEFACANVLKKSEISAAVNYMRQGAILGNDEMGQRGMDFVRQATDADYLVLVKLNSTPSMHFITFTLVNPRKNKTLVMKTGSGSGTEFMDRLIDEFVNEAAYHEICPYKGSVNVDVNTTRKTNKTDRIDVECNEQFQQKVVTQKFETNEKTEWKLIKNGKNQGTGEMSYNKTEERIHTEEDPCYPCASGRVAGRTSTETYFETAEGSGISNDARNAVISTGSGRDEVFSDVRFKINFQTNGTYTLKVEATTVNIPATVKESKEAQGSCDAENEHKTDTYNTKISVDCILGPFSGTPFQKKLKESGSQPINKGDETGTTTYNFELNR